MFAFVIECVTTLLTMQKKTRDKEKSVRKIVQQFLTTDYVNVAEVLQVYPLGLFASPKPKRTAQDQNCKYIHAISPYSDKLHTNDGVHSYMMACEI